MTKDSETTDRLIRSILLLPTFSFKRFSKDDKRCVDKVGVDLQSLHRLLNQYKSKDFYKQNEDYWIKEI